MLLVIVNDMQMPLHTACCMAGNISMGSSDIIIYITMVAMGDQWLLWMIGGVLNYH